MKVVDMKKKSVSELEKHANKLRGKINDKRLAIATKDDKHVRELRALRKELAQTLTIAKQVPTTTKEKKS